MKEIEANKNAWNMLASEHYSTFKERLERQDSLLSSVIKRELGDIKGKKIIHLQCNTGADTISLARMGAQVTGVDLAPENILYAKMLAKDLNIEVDFIECDIMQLAEVHHEKYDIVFTSEGAIGWLPDLKKWALTIRKLLKDDGFFYVNDAHPCFLSLDEDAFVRNKLLIKYPYFGKQPDMSETIGGYASDVKEATNYFWMYTISDLINSLTKAGLVIEYFNEYEHLCYRLGDMIEIEPGVYQNPFFKGKFPLQFSLKASVRDKR
jgi:SAM-dependent methyltransferase